MDYTSLGRTGIKVSSLCLGTMNFGQQTSEADLAALHIRRACEDSLRRRQTDYLDLYQMHHVWREAPWTEVWQAMELLVEQGKVIYKAVTAPIIGLRAIEQLDGSLRALKIEISGEMRKKIDEIFPGFRPSPEGYAW